MCKECAEVPSSEGANGLWQILKELSFKTLLPHVVDIFFLFVELHLFYSDLTSLCHGDHIKLYITILYFSIITLA